MVTTVLYGDNPSRPSAGFSQYDPDRLIAGHFDLVTKSVTITGAAALKRGTILGRVSVGAAGAGVAAGGNTGNGTLSAIVVGPQAKTGVYTLEFTGATTYNVIDPSGNELAPGTAAGAYGVTPAPNAQIHWTFTAGGTPMVAGDRITVTVATAATAYKLAVATANDGSGEPCAVLADDADATLGDVKAGVYLTGQFNQDRVILDPSFTVPGIIDTLRKYSIFLTPVVTAQNPT